MNEREKEIYADALKAADGDRKAAADALCDGEYLTQAGYTDDDQDAIETAYAELINQNEFLLN